MLVQVAAGLWTEHRSLRFLGVETGTRMTVVRLRSGDLFVHSPVSLDAATKAAVDALGTVRTIVAPSLFHHLFVPAWTAAYPRASVYGCPGLEKKRKDVTWTGILSDAPAAEWQGELEQVFFGARSLENEVVFFHDASKTLVCSDFVFNLSSHPSRFTRFVAGVLGQREPGATWLERVMIRDRASAREQVGRVLAWPVERIVLGHGDLVPADGHGVIERAYRWL